MNITENIINDLMPAYFSGECSIDTKHIVEEYFQDHPEFARQSRKQYESPFADKSLPRLKAENEVKALRFTRRLIKIRIDHSRFCNIFLARSVFVLSFGQTEFYPDCG